MPAARPTINPRKANITSARLTYSVVTNAILDTESQILLDIV